MLYLRMIACWLEHTRLFDLIGERERRVKKGQSKIGVSGPSFGKERKKFTRKVSIATASFSPLPHTRRRGQRKASHRMKTISERIFPRCNPLVHLRAVSLPSRARDVHFKPSTQKRKFRRVGLLGKTSETNAYHARPPLALSFG